MSYLLSTTYPSRYGLVAAEYACGLALVLRCPLKLVHAYTVPVTLGEMPLPVMPAEDMRNIATGHVDAALAKLRNKFPELEISSELAYGDITDVLNETAQENEPFLTIIGNDEESDIDAWIGGSAGTTLRESSHPVLAIPHATSFSILSRVCIATDGRSIDEGVFSGALLRLQKACNFHITVLHILKEGESPVVFSESVLGRQLGSENTSYVEIITSGNIDSDITVYASSQGIDWLAVIPHHYGFWEGLFHKSHTAQMLNLAHIPVLALH